MGKIIYGFPPITGPCPRVLILGSMPSERSIEAGQYYGYPRNHFWEIIYFLLKKPLPSDYKQRVAGVQEAGIAIWDSIAGCRREGSLDQAIEDEVYNNVSEFITQHPTLRLVVFNGRKAEQAFYAGVRQREKPRAAENPPDKKTPAEDLTAGVAGQEGPDGTGRRGSDRIRFIRLPSTSPIPTRKYRRMEDKIRDWKIIADYLEGEEK